MPEYKCCFCGKIFDRHSSHVRSKNIFCSRKCKDKSQDKGTIKTCLECGKTFHITPDRINIAKFCSFKCKGEYQSKNNVGENHPNYKQPIFINCIICGKPIKTSVYLANLGRKKVCSIKCRNKHVSNSLSGTRLREKNPNWLGGRSFLLYPREFDDIKNLIRERDDYRCQLCTQSEFELGSTLHVHHMNRDKHDCSPNNLISLCNACHKRQHIKSKNMEAVF